MMIRNAALAVLLLAGGPAIAQQMPHGHGAPGHAMPQAPATDEMGAAMEKMSRDMMQGMTGDPDQDFARMMAVHHEGAIDMARIFLNQGRDPQLRALARTIIDDQQKEVAELRQWLKEHPASK